MVWSLELSTYRLIAIGAARAPSNQFYAVVAALVNVCSGPVIRILKSFSTQHHSSLRKTISLEDDGEPFILQRLWNIPNANSGHHAEGQLRKLWLYKYVLRIEYAIRELLFSRKSRFKHSFSDFDWNSHLGQWIWKSTNERCRTVYVKSLSNDRSYSTAFTTAEQTATITMKKQKLTKYAPSAGIRGCRFILLNFEGSTKDRPFSIHVLIRNAVINLPLIHRIIVVVGIKIQSYTYFCSLCIR